MLPWTQTQLRIERGSFNLYVPLMQMEIPVLSNVQFNLRLIFVFTILSEKPSKNLEL